MTPLEGLVALVNFVLLALIATDRIDKIYFNRFVAVAGGSGLLALKLGILKDPLVLGRLIACLGLIDLALVAAYYIVLAVRRRRPSAKGNILTRLERTYAPTERRVLPDSDRSELAEITTELEKQGFHALADFEEVEENETHGPMRAFLSDDRTTAALAFLREDSRKKIQPTAVSFLTQLSNDRWVITSPMPSKRSFATLERPPNVHGSFTGSGWSVATAAKAHATHVADQIAEQGGTTIAIENTFEAWCERRDAYWAEVCAHREKVGWLTEAESMSMFGNDLAYHEVQRLLPIANRRKK